MTETADSIFSTIPADLPVELETLLLSGRQFRLKRIVSRGHSTPPGEWYDQEQAEWVMLLSGSARLEYEDGQQLTLTPGDHLTISPHCRHRVAWTDPEVNCVWLALYFAEPQPPRRQLSVSRRKPVLPFKFE